MVPSLPLNVLGGVLDVFGLTVLVELLCDFGFKR